MKRIILSMLCALACCGAWAQNILEVHDTSDPLGVYSNDKRPDAALVIVTCHKSIPLSFESTMDKTTTPYTTESEGNDSVYYIEFPTGKKYKGRMLTIWSPGYNKASYDLDLQPKQLVHLNVIDPNSLVDAGCYREHRNKGMEEFKKGNYSEARDEFTLADQCAEVNKEENDANIAMVDSVEEWRNEADLYFNLMDYSEAGKRYQRVLAYNPDDSYASTRYYNCADKFNTECNMLYKQADFYFKQKEYTKAKTLFQTIIDKDCNMSAQAIEKVQEIEAFNMRKRDHARVLTYEYLKDQPIGLSYGTYNMHKAGGFFTLGLNTKIFEMARSNNTLEDMPEANISFGWTFKIANPVWAFIGPGVTSKFYYGDYNDNYVPGKEGTPVTKDGKEDVDWSTAIQDYDGEEGDYKINCAIAVSPTLGLCVKYSYFALRITYQYRFCLQKDLQDFMGAHRIGFGIGVAF